MHDRKVMWHTEGYVLVEMGTEFGGLLPPAEGEPGLAEAGGDT